MKTKLLTLVMLLTLSAATAFGQLKEVATLTVSPDRQGSHVSIFINGVSGQEVTINGETPQTFGDSGNLNFVNIPIPADRVLRIKAEDYSSIYSILCSGNNLISLDISKLTALERLQCFDNEFTSLDVSKNVNLQYLLCYNNNLTSLDVSKNLNLLSLSCYNNNLTSLNVSNNLELFSLLCYNNRLTSLDLSGLTFLRNLNVSGNLFISFRSSASTRNASGNSLDAFGLTSLQTLDISDNALTYLDVSGLTALEDLDCSGNNLTSLNVSENIALHTLDVSGNALSSLELPSTPLTGASVDNQDVVIEIPFDYSGSTVDVYFNGATYALSEGPFSITAGGITYSGTISIVRASAPVPVENKYSVTFISEAGVTINRESSDEVVEGYDFRFYTTIADEYADYDLIVLVNGEELSPTVHDNMYVIKNVDGNKEVRFILTAKGDAPTSNEQLSATVISTGVGEITIEVPTSALIQIVSISGKVVYSASVSGTTIVNVPTGIYVVVVDGESTKVVVR